MIVLWGAEENLDDVGWFDRILWAQQEAVIHVMQLLESADDPDLRLGVIDDA